MQGGEVFIPKVPSMRILDLAQTIAPQCRYKFVGIRPGEKLHEILVPEDESHNTFEIKDKYVILTPFQSRKNYKHYKLVKDGFRYSSDTNTAWLSVNHLKGMLKDAAKK